MSAGVHCADCDRLCTDVRDLTSIIATLCAIRGETEASRDRTHEAIARARRASTHALRIAFKAG